MSENEKDIKWDNDVEISYRPIMLKDFITLDESISKAMDIMRTAPKDVQKVFSPVFEAAIDMCAYYADVLDIDPCTIETDKYVSLIYKDKK